MQKMKIIYYSAAGNTKFVAEEIAGDLISKGWEVDMSLALQSTADDIIDNQNILLASPTYDHGLLRPEFYAFLSRVEKSGADLSDKKFWVVGLGDSKYDQEHVVEAATILEDWVIKQGGQLMQTIRINKSPLVKREIKINVA